ncbi:MAG: HEAT repeat domain-containing protein [Sandaracinaceae bacterium]|nr:HEAT repeat domain-containing protein [Sandaracinaceae bacterium]
MKRRTIVLVLAALGALLGLVAIGCHADPDDAAGQANELGDGVRRENAIANLSRLYTNALAAASGDRTAETVGQPARPGPKAIADASIEQLVNTYLQHPEDSQNGRRIIDLLREMQDPRGLRAFTKALEWRQEVNEEHAISAAQAIERMEVPEDQKGPAIDALSNALDRVQGARGVDNRMRIQFIRALGHLEDRRATPILTKVATRLAEDQNFLINRMAAEELGKLRDPAAIPAMIRGLYLFAPGNPRMRMNDVAAQALVQIGRPALEPLVATLRGQNEEATRTANQYIAAVRQQNAAAAEGMNAQTIVIGEACYALGQLGFREALDPMLEQITPLTRLAERDIAADSFDPEILSRAHGCLVSLVSLTRSDADTPRVREALIQTYQRVPKAWPPAGPGSGRSQLLVAMQHSYDPGLLDTLFGISNTPEDEIPDLRVLAVRSYAYLANGTEAGRLRDMIAREPGPEEGGFRTNFEENSPALVAAGECNEDLQCWIRKLGDSNPVVVRKAAYMIARYGRGNDAAITALIEHIDHRDQFVRGDVLYAIDFIATAGSDPAVQEIDAVRGREEGRSSWNQIRELAMAVRARLQARRSGG